MKLNEFRIGTLVIFNDICYLYLGLKDNKSINYTANCKMGSEHVNLQLMLDSKREEKNANTISCEQYNTSILNSIYYK